MAMLLLMDLVCFLLKTPSQLTLDVPNGTGLLKPASPAQPTGISLTESVCLFPVNVKPSIVPMGTVSPVTRDMIWLMAAVWFQARTANLLTLDVLTGTGIHKCVFPAVNIGSW